MSMSRKKDREVPLSKKVEEFRETFNGEMTQFLGTIKRMEERIEKLSRAVPATQCTDIALEDAKEKQKNVHRFFFEENYTDALSHRPPSVDVAKHRKLLTTLAKQCYETAKEVCLTEAKCLLERLFRCRGYPDDDEEDCLQRVKHAYGILVSCIPAPKREKIIADIRQKASARFSHFAEIQKTFEQCCSGKENPQNVVKFVGFHKYLPVTSFTMATAVPPMILHMGDNNINKLWLQSPVAPPLQWVRPIILKDYHGMPLVQGIAEGKVEEVDGYIAIG